MKCVLLDKVVDDYNINGDNAQYFSHCSSESHIMGIIKKKTITPLVMAI